MALPVEEMQRPEINSFTDGLILMFSVQFEQIQAVFDIRLIMFVISELGGNALESSLGDHPRVKQAVTQVFASGISGSVRLLIRGTTGDLEAGGSRSNNVNTQEGFPDQEGQEETPGLEPEEIPGSVGSVLLDDFTDIGKVAQHLKHPETYLTGLLMYEMHSAVQTLKDGISPPTPAKKTLWYLVFGNIGTLFVLFIMLACAPKGSTKASILVKSMTAAGVLLFGLNLAMLFLKDQP
ncbi:hypothetical protein CRG98_015764 [Punica granatum]|uniref:Uncharacterized protein n=1 Tax=Punica granatum TaxID=22663 RepID=A0A2I0K6K1_PUNGR|nr:hypothetical protein CRG98_015764 [Punica granatum]